MVWQSFLRLGKERWILPGMVLLWIGSWKGLYLPAWQEYHRHKALKQEVNDLLTAPLKIKQLEKKLSLKSGSVGVYDRDTLVQQVAAFADAEGLRITSFPEGLLQTVNGSQLATSTLEVQGTFAQILALTYHLEYEQKLTHIASQKYFIHRDPLSRQRFLRASLVLRNRMP
jgi:hypothetical protein